MTSRKFHKTVVQITILSEEEIGSVTPEQIAYQISGGEWSGYVEITSRQEINGADAAKGLMEQGSDPEFFRITEEGEELYPDSNDDAEEHALNGGVFGEGGDVIVEEDIPWIDGVDGAGSEQDLDREVDDDHA